MFVALTQAAIKQTSAQRGKLLVQGATNTTKFHRLRATRFCVNNAAVKSLEPIATVALLLLAMGLIGFSLVRPREPAYQGRPLSVWLDDLMKGHYGVEHDQAEEAIRQIGTNSIPALLNLIASEESEFDKNFRKLSAQIPFLRYQGKPVAEHREKAKRAFAALGPLAKPAIPQLNILLNQESCSKDVVAVLDGLGPAGEAAFAQHRKR